MGELGWQEARQVVSKLPFDFGASEQVPLHAAGGRVLAAGVPGAEGAVVLAAGKRIGPGDLAALARCGATKVEARPRPRVLAVAGPGAGIAPVLFCAWSRLLGAEVAIPCLLDGDRGFGEESLAWAGLDLVALLGAKGARRPDALVVPGLDMAPGGASRLWRGPGSTYVIELPGDPAGLMAAFHVLGAPLLGRLAGEEGLPEARKALLRFSKVSVAPENRWYPGRFLADPGGAAIAHLSEDPGNLGKADCLFFVLAGQWLRDGDLVAWLPLAGRS